MVKKHRHKPKLFLQGRRGPSWRCTVCYQLVKSPADDMQKLYKWGMKMTSPRS